MHTTEVRTIIFLVGGGEGRLGNWRKEIRTLQSESPKRNMKKNSIQIETYMYLALFKRGYCYLHIWHLDTGIAYMQMTGVR